MLLLAINLDRYLIYKYTIFHCISFIEIIHDIGITKKCFICRAIANETVDTIDQLEEIMVQRCRTLLQLPKLIQGLTNYHWWPNDLI